ncbi:MAG: hypothetical protein HQM08_03385 [Candidatus Riflebacteria bacterium]|nr:hypothetical protein [Candidatus Riflebacteria bacterium]
MAFLSNLSPAFTIKEAIFAVSLFGVSTFSSYALSARFLGNSNSAFRFVATGIIWHWLMIGLFFFLSTFGLFMPLYGLLGWTIVLFATINNFENFRFVCNKLLSDIRNFLSRLGQAFESENHLLWIAGIFILILAAFRAALVPPISWDSMLYHLVVAGKWVQDGALTYLSAPGDFSDNHIFYPFNVEIIFAWFMSPFHGDLMVNFANFPAFFIAFSAFYQTGKLLGVRPKNSAIAGFLLVFNPSIFSFINTSYVDIWVTSQQIASLMLLISIWRKFNVFEAFLLSGSLGCAFGSKLPTIPIACLGLAVLLFCFLKNSEFNGWKKFKLLFLLSFVFLLPASPWYIRNFIWTGSPIYPMGLKVMGTQIFPKSKFQEWCFFHGKTWYFQTFLNQQRAEYRFWKTISSPSFNGFGPIAFFILAYLPLGFFSTLRSERRFFLAYSLACFLVSISGLFSEDFTYFRFLWGDSYARMLTFTFALTLLYISFAFDYGFYLGKGLQIVFSLLMAFTLFYQLPHGWFLGDSEINPIIQTLPIVLLFIPSLPWFLQKITQRIWKFGISLIILLCLLTGILLIKNDFRFWLYSHAFELHYFSPPRMEHLEICDKPTEQKRIAFSAGWEGKVGDNWLWYPLMGMKLQNSLCYIPTSPFGEKVDYSSPEKIPEKADFKSWTKRLEEQKIDIVVLYNPLPVEHKWVSSNPSLFKPLDQGSPHQVFQFLGTNNTIIGKHE